MVIGIGIIQYSPGTSTHTSFRIHIVNTYRHPRTYAHTLISPPWPYPISPYFYTSPQITHPCNLPMIPLFHNEPFSIAKT